MKSVEFFQKVGEYIRTAETIMREKQNPDKGRDSMQDLENTQYFKVETEPVNGVKMILAEVYEALSEKGYDPVSQIVGYIMSGDPTYITSYRNARGLIGRVERDELVEEMFKDYIENNHWKPKK